MTPRPNGHAPARCTVKGCAFVGHFEANQGLCPMHREPIPTEVATPRFSASTDDEADIMRRIVEDNRKERRRRG